MASGLRHLFIASAAVVKWAYFSFSVLAVRGNHPLLNKFVMERSILEFEMRWIDQTLGFSASLLF